MKCPFCNLDFVMTDRQGIEIDYCPKCRGVWLDRSELDKIIERSMSESTADVHSPEDLDHQQKRRRSFLGDLFDFD